MRKKQNKIKYYSTPCEYKQNKKEIKKAYRTLREYKLPNEEKAKNKIKNYSTPCENKKIKKKISHSL